MSPPRRSVPKPRNAPTTGRGLCGTVQGEARVRLDEQQDADGDVRGLLQRVVLAARGVRLTQEEVVLERLQQLPAVRLLRPEVVEVPRRLARAQLDGAPPHERVPDARDQRREHDVHEGEVDLPERRPCFSGANG